MVISGDSLFQFTLCTNIPDYILEKLNMAKSRLSGKRDKNKNASDLYFAATMVT